MLRAPDQFTSLQLAALWVAVVHCADGRPAVASMALEADILVLMGSQLRRIGSPVEILVRKLCAHMVRSRWQQLALTSAFILDGGRVSRTIVHVPRVG